MEIERNYLIMLLYGYYMCKYPNSSGKDMVIRVDNHFTTNNNLPMSDEEIKLVNDLYDQMWLLLKVDGLNRQDFRSMSRKK